MCDVAQKSKIFKFCMLSTCWFCFPPSWCSRISWGVLLSSMARHWPGLWSELFFVFSFVVGTLKFLTVSIWASSRSLISKSHARVDGSFIVQIGAIMHYNACNRWARVGAGDWFFHCNGHIELSHNIVDTKHLLVLSMVVWGKSLWSLYLQP